MRTSRSSSTITTLRSGTRAPPDIGGAGHGQEEREARAPLRPVLDLDRPPVRFRHALHDRKPEAGAALAPAEERLEQPVAVLGADPPALVLDPASRARLAALPVQGSPHTHHPSPPRVLDGLGQE